MAPPKNRKLKAKRGKNTWMYQTPVIVVYNPGADGPTLDLDCQNTGVESVKMWVLSNVSIPLLVEGRTKWRNLSGSLRGVLSTGKGRQKKWVNLKRLGLKEGTEVHLFHDPNIRATVRRSEGSIARPYLTWKEIRNLAADKSHLNQETGKKFTKPFLLSVEYGTQPKVPKYWQRPFTQLKQFTAMEDLPEGELFEDADIGIKGQQVYCYGKIDDEIKQIEPEWKWIEDRDHPDCDHLIRQGWEEWVRVAEPSKASILVKREDQVITQQFNVKELKTNLRIKIVAEDAIDEEFDRLFAPYRQQLRTNLESFIRQETSCNPSTVRRFIVKFLTDLKDASGRPVFSKTYHGRFPRWFYVHSDDTSCVNPPSTSTSERTCSAGPALSMAVQRFEVDIATYDYDYQSEHRGKRKPSSRRLFDAIKSLSFAFGSDGFSEGKDPTGQRPHHIPKHAYAQILNWWVGLHPLKKNEVLNSTEIEVWGFSSDRTTSLEANKRLEKDRAWKTALCLESILNDSKYTEQKEKPKTFVAIDGFESSPTGTGGSGQGSTVEIIYSHADLLVKEFKKAFPSRDILKKEEGEFILDLPASEKVRQYRPRTEGRTAPKEPLDRKSVIIFKKARDSSLEEYARSVVVSEFAHPVFKYYQVGKAWCGQQASNRLFFEVYYVCPGRFVSTGGVSASSAGPTACHISVLLKSNSGAVALANRPYQIRLDDGTTLEGETDDEGLIEHSGVPPGDYALEVDGQRTDTLVPTSPMGMSRSPLRVAGFQMFDEVEPTESEDYDPDEDLVAEHVADANGGEGGSYV